MAKKREVRKTRMPLRSGEKHVLFATLMRRTEAFQDAKPLLSYQQIAEHDPQWRSLALIKGNIFELAVKIYLVQKQVQLGAVGGGHLLGPSDIDGIGAGCQGQPAFQYFADSADGLFAVC